MRWLSIVILTFFCFQNSKAQDDNKLSWNENTKLVWNNFEAYPDSNSTSAAITYSEISYGLSAEIINDKVSVNYEVKCFFIPGKSWVKKELADDKYEGRGPGSRGDAAARQYLASELEKLGLEPGADNAA